MPDEINWMQEHVDGGKLDTADKAMDLCDHWRCLAIQAREENADLKAQLERLRQAADSDMKRLVAYGGKRIKELEGIVEDLTESNNTWLEVAADVGRELDIVPDVAIAHAPERIRKLKAEIERLKGRPEKWPFK